MPTPTITRRKLIRSGTGAALAAPVAVPLASFVAGCGDDEDSGDASPNGAAKTQAPAEKGRPRDSQEALDRLLAGNERFVADTETEVGRHTVRRVELAHGQEPFAVILGCADSRVPPEVIFDQGLGELFVARVAGNTVLAPAIVGSIEYAVAEFGSVLVMVLGHQECGAVKGAVEAVNAGVEVPGSIGDVIDPIVPVVELVSDKEPDLSETSLVEKSVRANVRNSVDELLGESELLAEGHDSGDLKVIGAEYVLESGEILVFE